MWVGRACCAIIRVSHVQVPSALTALLVILLSDLLVLQVVHASQAPTMMAIISCVSHAISTAYSVRLAPTTVVLLVMLPWCVLFLPWPPTSAIVIPITTILAPLPAPLATVNAIHASLMQLIANLVILHSLEYWIHHIFANASPTIMIRVQTCAWYVRANATNAWVFQQIAQVAPCCGPWSRTTVCALIIIIRTMLQMRACNVISSVSGARTVPLPVPNAILTWIDSWATPNVYVSLGSTTMAPIQSALLAPTTVSTAPPPLPVYNVILLPIALLLVECVLVCQATMTMECHWSAWHVLPCASNVLIWLCVLFVIVLCIVS